MSNNAHTARVAADLADWMATVPMHTLPEICTINFGRGTTVQMQIGAGIAPLVGLADWAEYLDTTVSLTPPAGDDHFWTAITVPLAGEAEIRIWNLLGRAEWTAVEAQLLLRELTGVESYSLDAPADVLRKAAQDGA